MDVVDLLRWYEVFEGCWHVYYCDIRQSFAFVRDKFTGEEKRARVNDDGTYTVMTLEEFRALFA